MSVPGELSYTKTHEWIDPTANPALRTAIRSARRAMIPDACVQRVLHYARQGFDSIEFPTFDTDWDSGAYATVSGQHTATTVRVTDAFLRAVREDAPWDGPQTRNRVDRSVTLRHPSRAAGRLAARRQLCPIRFLGPSLGQ